MPVVQLFKEPAVRVNGKVVKLPQGKSAALLYFLAYEDRAVHRDELLYLFWPDQAESKARTNLRQLLRSIKKLPFLENLSISKTHVQWTVETDIKKYKTFIADKNFHQAASIFKGLFLENFRFIDLPEFQSWLNFERNSLLNEFRTELKAQAKTQEASDNYQEAAQFLEYLHDLEPDNEDIFRHYFKTLYLSKQQEKALASFSTYQHFLEHQLGVKPSLETLNLVNALKAQNTVDTDISEQKTTRIRVQLPNFSTSFIGRQKELETLSSQLLKDDCRLLTLVAAGGMGKTRFSVKLAKHLLNQFPDGVYFIGFEAVTSSHGIVSKIIESLDHKVANGLNPQESLFDFLQDKSTLLIFDNMEHLVSDLSIIPDILNYCNNLKIIATSRERLNLQAEWLHDLDGLSHSSEDSDAFQLFVQSAKKAKSSFVVTTENTRSILQICEYLKGMPLATELAASWLRILPCEEVLHELKQDLKLLETTVNDIPQRHLNIQTVFESSWTALSETEQLLLVKISVFEGGFSKEAAEKATEIYFPQLLLLINKSFLKQGENNRFEIHPLIQQFIRQKALDHDQLKDIEKEHCQYYLNYVKRYENFFEHDDVKASRSAIFLEIANIQKAWNFATHHEREDLLFLADFTLFICFLYEARMQEGMNFFKEASQVITSESLVHARILHRYSALRNLAGENQESREMLERSLALTRKHESPWDIANTLLSLCFNYMFLDYVTGPKLASMWHECGELFNQTNDYLYVGRALFQQVELTPDSKIRQSLIEQSLDILNHQKGYFELGHAYSIYSLHTVFTHGNYPEALSSIDKSIEIQRGKGNPKNLTRSLMAKGDVLFMAGKYEEALCCYDEVTSMTPNHMFFHAYSYCFQKSIYLRTLLKSKDPLPTDEAIEEYQSVEGCYLQAESSILEEDFDKALLLSKQAFEMAAQIQCIDIQIANQICLIHLQLAKLCFRSKQVSEAKKSFKACLDLALAWSFKPIELALIGLAPRLFDTNSSFCSSALSFVIRHDASMNETKVAAKKYIEQKNIRLTSTEFKVKHSSKTFIEYIQNELL